MRARGLCAAVCVVVLLGMAAGGCGPQETARVPLRVLYAGSVIIPFEALESPYEAAHPNVDLQMEGHGSIQVIRHVTELHEPTDVVVTADHALIPMLMYQVQVPETGRPYADWYVEFATNRLALAYTPQSRYADEIDADNWFQIIARPDVKLGIADPRFDASGYRALMALRLAESYYNQPTILADLIMGRFRTPIVWGEEAGRTVIHVPEILEPKPGSGIVVRGASIQLIALLESGDLDYAFEYESVIEQHGLQVVRLPDAVNLGSEVYAGRYGQVEARMDFQRFASVTPVFDGDVIGYGVTIPSNAPHPAAAEEFVAYLLGPEGQALFDAYHHPRIVPPRADRYEALPALLQPLCVPMP